MVFKKKDPKYETNLAVIKKREGGLLAYKMYAEGKSLTDIAEHLDVAKATAGKYLVEAINAALPGIEQLVAKEIILQVERLDYLYAASMSAFVRSCKAKKSTTKGRISLTPTDPDDVPEFPERYSGLPIGIDQDTSISKSTDSAGDVRWLTEARHILADKRKLLGLDNPQVVQHQIQVYQQSQVTIEDNRNASLDPLMFKEIAKLAQELGVTPESIGLPRPSRSTSLSISDDAEADQVHPPQAYTEAEFVSAPE